MENHMLPTVILAGGLATRLRPVTETLPKALISINGQAFIDHQLRLLHSYGIRDIVLCVGYLGEMIEAHVGDGHHLGMRVQYSYDGPTLLGTGGTIKRALHLLSDAFFVLYGDSYLHCDYAAIQHTFAQSQRLGLMTVFHNKGLWDTSNIEYANGQIIVYDKQNRSERMHHIDYGLGILTREVFKDIPLDQPSDLALLYQHLLHQDQLAAFEVDQRFFEIGSFAGIKELEYYLARKELIENKKELPCNS